MHDANGTLLKIGDRVLIPGIVTHLVEGAADFCNVSVQTSLGRRPDGEKNLFSSINTGQIVKCGGETSGIKL